MGSLGEAIAQVQVYMGNHPGIRAAPRYPPGKLAIFPISVAYPGESEVHGGPMGVINGLYTVVIELHQARTDLEKDVEVLTDYSESVPKLLYDKHWNDGYWGGTISTFDRITFTFGPLGWAGVPTIGFRFKVHGVKIQQTVTS